MSVWRDFGMDDRKNAAEEAQNANISRQDYNYLASKSMFSVWLLRNN